MDYIISLFQNIGPFFILLGLLVFVHELGHFLVAKWCGVKVEVFSLGFGKKILKYTHGDTTYALSLIPLGGYVKMYGESLYAEVSEEQKNVSFIHKPVGQRIAIVLAGPLMNLFFAIFLFWAIGLIGEERPAPVVGDLASSSSAYTVGFRSGDKILRVNQQPVKSWSDVQDIIQTKTGTSVEFDISRMNQGQEEAAAILATPTLAANENIFSSSSQVGSIEGLTNEARAPLLGVLSKENKAYQVGFRTLDLVKKINDKSVTTYREFETALLDPKNFPAKIVVQSLEGGKPGDERVLEVASPESAETLGLEFSERYVAQVKKDSPANKAGILPGDKIVAINGRPIETWNDILDVVKNYDVKSEGLNVDINRLGEKLQLKMIPEMTELMTQKGQEENRFTIGIISANIRIVPETVLIKQEGFVNQISYGLSETWQWTEFTVMSVVRLVQGAVSPKNIGGVITIGRVASHSYEAGLSVFLKTMAIISINLFLLNLLPVPVLDGGHLVFFTIEALKGAPVSLRKMEIAQQAGLMILFMLMAFALFNDITNLFVRSW